MKWFKHMTDSSLDEKLSELIDIGGAEYYGLYWLVLETVARQMTKDPRTFVEYSDKKWSKLLGVSRKRSEKFLKTSEKLSLLFLEKNENFLKVDIPNLARYRDEYSKRTKPKYENIGTLSGQTQELVGSPIKDADADAETEEDKDNKKGTKALIRVKKKSTKQLEADKMSAMVTEYTTSDELRERLTDFLTMRYTLRPTITSNAFKLLLGKLNKIGTNDGEKIEIISNSVMNSWKGIFELKKNNGGGYQEKVNPASMILKALEEGRYDDN